MTRIRSAPAGAGNAAAPREAAPGNGKVSGAGRIGRAIWLAGTITLFFLGIQAWLAFHWMVEWFGTVSFETIIVHMNLPLNAADNRYSESLIIHSILGLLAAVLFGLFLRRCLRVHSAPRTRTAIVRALVSLFAAMVLCSSLWAWESHYKIGANFFPDMRYYSYIEDNFHAPDPKAAVFPKEKMNLVLLILESVEKTMNDPAVFLPPLMPRLGRLERENLSFSGYRGAVGTGASILSFYSTILGVPFLSSSRGLYRLDPVDGELKLRLANWLEKPQLRRHDFRNSSLPGILERHGYRLEVVRAASIRFANYDRLLDMATDHCGVYDFDYFRTIRPDHRERTNNWGVDDGYLYARARENLAALQETGQPFVQIIQTVNTHSPGYYEKDMPRRFGDFRDAFEQCDAMAHDFVAWILEQPFAPRTTVIILGDHNLLSTLLGPVELPPVRKREIVNIFINAKAGIPARGTQRVFAAWDLAPTILEALGVRLADRRFGLGVSLFADQDTLLEKDGLERCEEMLLKRSKLYEMSYVWWEE
ncbi:MAG: LTA synthase family protein [Planctomycetota bacterium]|jgi:phosphoglycerol transferase|nr:LTA synthase family protein [Planctomycetota bacterium]